MMNPLHPWFLAFILQKKNKNASGEKAKSTKSQNTEEKIKKKSKSQAVFVVGEFGYCS